MQLPKFVQPLSYQASTLCHLLILARLQHAEPCVSSSASNTARDRYSSWEKTTSLLRDSRDCFRHPVANSCTKIPSSLQQYAVSSFGSACRRQTQLLGQVPHSSYCCCSFLQRKIVERAKQMTDDDGADRSGQKAALQQEFEQLLNIFFTGTTHTTQTSTAKVITVPCSWFFTTRQQADAQEDSNQTHRTAGW